MNLFRVRGIQLAVHFSFFLLLGFVGWEGWQGDPGSAESGGWEGMAFQLGLVILCFTCVVLHELGHSLTALHFGVGVRRILLLPIGGMAEFDAIPRQPGRELLITIAGPAVNFAIAAGLWLLVGVPEGLPGTPIGNVEIPMNFQGMGQILLIWNLLMGVFNLMPVFPMDGGRIFRALLVTRLPYVRATFIATTVGKVLAIAGAVVAVMLERYMTGLLFTFIFFVGELEYRAVKRREREEAHWRAIMAARYSGDFAGEEPPVLVG